MAQDVGIFITQPGTPVANAPQNKLAMNTTYPFIKIDTQKPSSFQTITLLLTTDPPEPSGSAYKYTVVYKFKHGYTYRPALEALFYISNPGASTANGQTYFQNDGFISQHTVDDYANMYAGADSTWVYIMVVKFNDGAGLANLLTGTNVQISLHVFCEDVGV